MLENRGTYKLYFGTNEGEVVWNQPNGKGLIGNPRKGDATPLTFTSVYGVPSAYKITFGDQAVWNQPNGKGLIGNPVSEDSWTVFFPVQQPNGAYRLYFGDNLNQVVWNEPNGNGLVGIPRSGDATDFTFEAT